MRNKVLIDSKIHTIVQGNLNENNDLWNINDGCLFVDRNEAIDK